MTAKKDLKRRVRDRMRQTGERYKTALAHVRAAAPEAPEAPAPTKKPSIILESPPSHDLSEIARFEGFRCRAATSEPWWSKIEAEEGRAPAWFQLVFARLRQ